VVARKHVAVASDLELSERPGRRAAALLRVAASAKNTNGTASGKSAGRTLPTIERYMPETSNLSRLTRFAAKLRLGQDRHEQDR